MPKQACGAAKCCLGSEMKNICGNIMANIYIKINGEQYCAKSKRDIIDNDVFILQVVLMSHINLDYS